MGREIGNIVSPTRAVHLMLEMLDIKYVIQIIEETIVATTDEEESMTMKQFLFHCCNIGDNYPIFCKNMYEYTGGIPRLIIVSILSLVTFFNKYKRLDLSSLEILTRDTVVCRLYFAISVLKDPMWSDIHPCFSISTLQNREVVPDSPPVRYMPKITCAGVNQKSNEEMFNIAKGIPWSASVSDKDWTLVKNYFFAKEGFVQPAPQSRSSDLYFHIPPTTLVAFALKNYLKTILSQSKLNRFCNNNDCLVLNSGVYDFHEDKTNPDLIDEVCAVPMESIRNTPKNIGQYSKNRESSRLYIHKNMEVILLGEKAFTSFFTKQDLNILDYLSKGGLPNTEYLSNFQISFASYLDKINTKQ